MALGITMWFSFLVKAHTGRLDNQSHLTSGPNENISPCCYLGSRCHNIRIAALLNHKHLTPVRIAFIGSSK